MSTVLWHDENEFLAVTLCEDASVTITDKATGSQWRMANVALQEDGLVDIGHVWLRTTRTLCEQYPGRFQGKHVDNLLRFTVIGREHREIGQFSCHVSLQGAKLVFAIDDIDESLPSLSFPPPIISESLVLPMGVGKWIKEPLPERKFWTYPAHLNMRWFGGLQGEQGWIAILEEGYANAGIVATQLLVAPGWLKSLGTWTERRVISYQFVPGNYVTLAKVFRNYAIEHDLHHPLEEKLTANPALQNLHGGRLLSFMQAHTLKSERFENALQPVPEHEALDQDAPRVLISHAQVKQVIVESLQSGIEKAFVVLRGWIKGGYDETHPDIWPPEPALGTIEELQELVALQEPFTVALHDNYQDIYEQSASWPQGVIRLPSGEPMPGGYWAGGQAYILNARNGLAYARRNWPQIETLQPRAMFVDTIVAVQLYESYEPGNELRRAEDLAYKLELMSFYKEQGLVLGSEEGADFGVPWLDWIENRHARIAGESIPLWPLVYHDAVFNLRYGPGVTKPESTQSLAPRWLTDMLWGYPLLWGLHSYEQWQQGQSDFAELGHVEEWLRQIGSDEMVSHTYWSEDGQVEETTFASGKSILVNFAPEQREIDGVTVPGYGYIIR